MNWLLHPLVLYALLAASLALCLVLFLTLKNDLRVEAARRRLELSRIEKLQADLRLALLDLGDSRKQVDAAAEPAPAPLSVRGSLNLSRRAQILRMNKRGERPEQISAALGIPLNEVELLLKVHQVTVAPPAA